jgi:hypothetical protein
MLNRLKVLLFFSVAFCINIAYSQIYFGLKGGVNSSTVNVDTRNIANTEVGQQIGACVGAQFEYGFSDWFSLKTDLLFSSKGYNVTKYNSEDAFRLGNTQFSSNWGDITNYIELPFLANFYVEGRRYKFHFNVGPYAAFAINRTTFLNWFSTDLGSKEQPTSRSFSDSKPFQERFIAPQNRVDNRLDFGASVGAGVGYKVREGKGIVTIDVRYNYGLMALVSYKNQVPINYIPEYNQNWNFTIGYVILLKAKKIKKVTSSDEENIEE